MTRPSFRKRATTKLGSNHRRKGWTWFVWGLWAVIVGLTIALSAILSGLLDPALAFSGPVETISGQPPALPKLSGIKSAATTEPSADMQAGAETPPVIPPSEPSPEVEKPPAAYAEGPRVIGYSVEGRPLEVFRFGTGPEARMIVAGIHGGYEWNTTALAQALIEHLRTVPDVVPPHLTLHILPALNPDGLAQSQGYDGRANARGVDLNRNWPHDWAPDWPRNGCWDYRPITAGEGPASEPETQALLAFLQNHPITALISYHSAALGIFPGGLPMRLNAVDLAQDLADVSGYRYPPVATGCKITGNLVDWAAANGIAAVDLELLTHHDLDYAVNLKVLEAFLAWQPELTGR